MPKNTEPRQTSGRHRTEWDKPGWLWRRCQATEGGWHGKGHDMSASQPDLSRPFVVRLRLKKDKKKFDKSGNKKLTSERSVDGLDLEVLFSFDGVWR